MVACAMGVRGVIRTKPRLARTRSQSRRSQLLTSLFPSEGFLAPPALGTPGKKAELSLHRCRSGLRGWLNPESRFSSEEIPHVPPV